MTTEYYVLRLYRDSDNDVDNLLGTLEDVSSGICWSFSSNAELKRVVDKVAGLESKPLNILKVDDYFKN